MRHSLISHTAKRLAWILRRRLKGNLGMYLERISLDLEEEKELEMQLE